MIWRNKSILIFVACAIGGTIAVYLVVLRHEDVTIVDTWFLYIETIKKTSHYKIRTRLSK